MYTFLKVIIFLSFLIFILSCNSKKNVPAARSNILIEKKDGLIYKQKSEKPYTGIIVDTINNKITEYNVKDGLKNGRFKISYVNGQVEMEGNMLNDKNEGEWKYYFPNGQLESIGNFENDKPSGKWIFYYATGNKKEEGKFKEGKREGKWIEYDSTGIVKNFINFSVGDTSK